MKISVHVAGETLRSHEDFIKKLTKRGAKIVDSGGEKSEWTIVFCPIVSRYQTDIEAALSSLPAGAPGRKLILVAMHHSFNKDYIFPRSSQVSSGVELLTDCLFFDKMGLYKCPSNKKAVKSVRKKLNLKKYRRHLPSKKATKGEKKTKSFFSRTFRRQKRTTTLNADRD